MKDCRKRQVERRGDETLHRCINKQSDEYRKPVCESVCDSCPVRVLLATAKKKKPDPRKSILPVIDTSNYPSCEFRFRQAGHEPKCGVTGLSVDKEICQR